MSKVKRISPLSLGKIMGMIYAFLGLLCGFIIAFFSVFGAAIVGSKGSLGVGLGIGAIIFIPAFYGALGFLAGLLTAWLYNLAAKWVGGLELEIEISVPDKP